MTSAFDAAFAAADATLASLDETELFQSLKVPELPAVDQWGPFAPGLSPVERTARLRSLQAIVRLCCGDRGRMADEALRSAESDSRRLPAALAALNALEPVPLRRILGSHAALDAAAGRRRA